MSLFVPVFVWNYIPLSLTTASCMSLIYNLLVTGSENGHIVFWIIESHNDTERLLFVPQVITFTLQREPIIDLKFCTYKNKTRLISISANGSICIMSISDGRVLFSKTNLIKSSPSHLVVLPDSEHALVFGKSSIIEILDLSNLDVKVKLLCSNWIVELNCVANREKTHLIGIDFESKIFTYCLNHVSDSYMKYDNFFDLKEAYNLSSSPSGQLFLLLKDSEVHVYETQSLKILTIIEHEDSLKVAAWCDELRFVVFSNNGLGYMYSVPRSFLSLMENERIVMWNYHSTKLSSKLGMQLMVSMDDVKADTESNKKKLLFDIVDDGKFAELIIPSHLQDIYKQKRIYLNVVDNLISVGFGNGILLVWVVPFVWRAQSGKSNNDNSFGTKNCKLSPTVVTSLEELNNSLDVRVNVEGKWRDREQPYKITTSLLLSKKLFLVQGDNRGHIHVVELPSGCEIYDWKAHTSQVSSLISLEQNEREYLVSGSRDHYIKIWNITCKPVRLVHTFLTHTGPINALFTIEDFKYSQSSIWKQRFISFSNDDSIGLYHLDNSPYCINVYTSEHSGIVGVRWYPKNDYLIAKYLDGAFVIWEAESGQIDLSLLEVEPEVFWDYSDIVYDFEKSFNILDIGNQSVLNVKVLSATGEAPLQSIILNINRLCKDLSEIKEFYTAVVNKICSSSYEEWKLTVPGDVNQEQFFGDLYDKFTEALLAQINKSNKITYMDWHEDARVSYDRKFHSMSDLQLAMHSEFIKACADRLRFYKVCTYLIQWDVMTADLCEFLNLDLLMKQSKLHISYGTVGFNGAVSTLLPGASSSSKHWWTYRKNLSGAYLLASSTVMRMLCHFSYDEKDLLTTNAESRLLSLCGLLCERTVDINGLLSYYLKYWQDSSEFISSTVRMLFKASIEQFDSNKLSEAVEKYSQDLSGKSPKSSNAVLVMAVMCSIGRELLLDRDVLKLVAESLISLSLSKIVSARDKLLSIELFGMAIEIWYEVVPNQTSNTIYEMLKIYSSHDAQQNIKRAICKVLFVAGERLTHELIYNVYKYFLNYAKVTGIPHLHLHFHKQKRAEQQHSSDRVVGSEANEDYDGDAAAKSFNANSSVVHGDSGSAAMGAVTSKFFSKAQKIKELLQLLLGVVRGNCVNFAPELTYLIDAVMIVLKSQLKKVKSVVLDDVMKLISELDVKYPSVELNRELQKLLVGTDGGKVVLYDLSNGAKLFSFTTETKPISAIAFVRKDRQFAVYYASKSAIDVYKSKQLMFGAYSEELELIKTIDVPWTIPLPSNDTQLIRMQLEGLQVSYAFDSNSILIERSWEIESLRRSTIKLDQV